MAERRRGKRAKSEMNVVPYIDVMLVLLVIFMISAPLLNQSVEVNLPNSNNAVDIEQPQNESEAPLPLVVTIDSSGAFYIDRIDDNALPVSIALIQRLTEEALQENQATPVYVRADKAVAYGSVMQMMDVLKSSGADAVGLITENKE